VSCAPCLHPQPFAPPRGRVRTYAQDAGAHAEVRRRAGELGAISGPAAFAWMIEPLLAGERQEVAHVTVLDIYGALRRVREVARGTYDQVEVPIPVALRAAVDASSRYLILSHNHPTGWAWPSEADAELTDEVERAAWEVDLVLLDHVVLGKNEFYSFREGQLWQVKT
jgi:DNA repair protein RadC